MLSDGRKPLPVRLAVVRTVRMYHGWRPTENHDPVQKCLEAMIAQGELADIAIEDMRRWKMWDRTPDILGLYGKKGFDAPIMERAIVRYALSCGDEASKKFVAERRQVRAGPGEGRGRVAAIREIRLKPRNTRNTRKEEPSCLLSVYSVYSVCSVVLAYFFFRSTTGTE